MDTLEKLTDFLRSKEVIALFAVVGFLAGVVRLFGYAVPAAVETVATVFLALVGLYVLVLVVSFPLRRRTAPTLGGEASESDAETSFRYMSQRYGIGHDMVKVEWSIARNGSARVQRTVTVLAHSEISELDTFLVIPEKPPEGTAWDIGFIDVKSLTKGRDVTLAYMPPQEGKQGVALAISPPLRPGETLCYRMIQELPEGFYAIDLTETELAKRQTPLDYCGWTINRPTRRLSLTAYFPDDFKPRIYSHDVRYMSAAPGIPSARTQAEERQRLDSPVLSSHEVGRHYLQLEPEYPMLGLIYILQWKPIPISEKTALARPPATGSTEDDTMSHRES